MATNTPNNQLAQSAAPAMNQRQQDVSKIALGSMFMFVPDADHDLSLESSPNYFQTVCRSSSPGTGTNTAIVIETELHHYKEMRKLTEAPVVVDGITLRLADDCMSLTLENE